MKLKMMTIPVVMLALTFMTTRPLEKKLSNRLDTNLTKCHATTQKFARLGSDPSFIRAHEDPESHPFQGVGKMITFPVADGADANAYFLKSEPASKDYLFVVHEWYGLNTNVKEEADKFFKQYKNMNVVALDLYDGQVADNRDDAARYMQSVKTERALAIINGAKSFAGADARIFTVGWCFGGGWSLQTAIELGDQAAGAVMFYGMPERDIDRLKTLKCDVLAIFAGQDQWITPEVATQFEKDMATASKKLTLKSYDAGHGFANPSNPIYNEEAATDAYKNMTAFVKARR